MNIGKTLFAQFMDFLPPTTFTLIVTRYGGDRYVESLTFAEQFRIMGFAQLAYCERLRDIEVCLSGRRRSSPTWGSVRRSSAPRWLAPTLTISRCRRQPFARSTRCAGQVELFFKWIQQYLHIKRFFGTSENAMQSQIWIPVSVYVLAVIVEKRLTLKAALYTLLQIVSLTLFEKMPTHVVGGGGEI